MLLGLYDLPKLGILFGFDGIVEYQFEDHGVILREASLVYNGIRVFDLRVLLNVNFYIMFAVISAHWISTVFLVYSVVFDNTSEFVWNYVFVILIEAISLIIWSISTIFKSFHSKPTVDEWNSVIIFLIPDLFTGLIFTEFGRHLYKTERHGFSFGEKN